MSAADHDVPFYSSFDEPRVRRGVNEAIPEYDMAFLLAHSKVDLDAPQPCIQELNRGNFSMREIKIACIGENWDPLIERAKKMRAELLERRMRGLEQARKMARASAPLVAEFFALAVFGAASWFAVIAIYAQELV